MTNLAQLTERELLVRLDGKFDMMEGRVQRMEETVLLLSNWKIAMEASSRARIGIMAAVERSPSVLWAIAATAGMMWMWIH